MKSLRELLREAYDIAKSKGWHDTERSFPELIALMHSELSESLESYRDNEDAIVMRDDGKPDGYGIELADAVIRVMDACEHLGLDLESLVMTKMAYNRTRPYRHGGKKV